MTSQTITALGTSIINLINRKTPIATASTVGMVKPDGNTINIDSNGVISSNGGSGSSLEICDIGLALYIDETKGLRRYLNGQIVDINTNTQAFLNRLQEITTLHPSLLCTEEEWQTAKTMSTFGQVGKFVFNYSGGEIVSVRIPRVVNVQGLFDLQNLGMTVSAGLPNIAGSIQSPVSIIGYGNQGNKMTFSGAFSGKVTTKPAVDSNTTNNTNCYEYDFDASKSNPIYGNSNTVQPEAIQYPYFIQIATGSETEANIVNTLENVNGFTLLESKYSDKPLYNESWLLSNGQWNSKAVYPTVYEGLQVEYNSEIESGTTVTLPSGLSYTKRGLSVKLSTETYTDYDFVLNTAEETFRLPLLDGSEDLPSDRYINLKLLSSGSVYTAPANGIVSFNKVAGAADKYANIYVRFSDQSASYSTGVSATTSGQNLMVNAFVKKGVNYVVNYNATGATNHFKFTYAQGNGSLYFYIGETVQNANLIDAGRIGEQLATKTDMLQASGASMPSNKYIDLTLGASNSEYTAPANGYYFIASQGTSTNNWIEFRNGDISQGVYGTLGWGFKLSLPIAKGHTTQLAYNNINTTNYTFRFVYAEGEV